jgi:hypothetical protein
VFSVGAPRPTSQRDGAAGRLRVSHAASRLFDTDSAAARNPMLREYLSDLIRPYGLALRADTLDRGLGQSYGEMARDLLPDQPVDLIVYAFAVPDVMPGRPTAAYLSHLCPGEPLALAVCDQGVAAPYTALRLIGAYADGDRCKRALLVVVEQAAQHFLLPAPAAMPARHAAVTLLFSTDGAAGRTVVHQHPDTDPARAAELLPAELAALAADRDDVTLIAGPGLSAEVPTARTAAASVAAQVIVTPAGQPCTGAWRELADGLPGWRSAGRLVLLADYEPVLRYLCLFAIDVLPSRDVSA